MTQAIQERTALPQRSGVKTGVDSLISVMMGHRDGERRLKVSFAGSGESDVELSVHRELTGAKFLCQQEACAGSVAVRWREDGDFPGASQQYPCQTVNV